jgi:hypothetical protein
MTKPYLEPAEEFFDRTAMPPEIADLLDEWPEIDPGTARLIRAAISSRDPQQLRLVWRGSPHGPSWRGRGTDLSARRAILNVPDMGRSRGYGVEDQPFARCRGR